MNPRLNVSELLGPFNIGGLFEFERVHQGRRPCNDTLITLIGVITNCVVTARLQRRDAEKISMTPAHKMMLQAMIRSR